MKSKTEYKTRCVRGKITSSLSFRVQVTQGTGSVLGSVLSTVLLISFSPHRDFERLKSHQGRPEAESQSTQ